MRKFILATLISLYSFTALAANCRFEKNIYTTGTYTWTTTATCTSYLRMNDKVTITNVSDGIILLTINAELYGIILKPNQSTQLQMAGLDQGAYIACDKPGKKVGDNIPIDCQKVIKFHTTPRSL